MNQLTTVILIISGVILLAYVSGVEITNPLLDFMLSPESVQGGDLWVLVGLTLTSGVAGVVVGVYYRDIEKGVMTTITPLLASLLFNIVQIYIIMAASGFLSTMSATLLFGPLLFYLVYLLIDYWRGRD